MSAGFRRVAAGVIFFFLLVLALTATAERAPASLAITATIELVGLFIVLKLLAPRRFAWAGRVAGALVFLGISALLAAEVASGRGRWLTLIPGLAMGLPALSYALFGAWWRRDEIRLDPDDPLILAATARARATVPELRQLFADRPEDTFIKVPEEGTDGVWCEVVSMEAGAAQVRDERTEEIVPVPLDRIVDWMVELPDGAFRGNFSVSAMIALCERDGRAVPEVLARMRPLLQDAAA